MWWYWRPRNLWTQAEGFDAAMSVWKLGVSMFAEVFTRNVTWSWESAVAQCRKNLTNDWNSAHPKDSRNCTTVRCQKISHSLRKPFYPNPSGGCKMNKQNYFSHRMENFRLCYISWGRRYTLCYEQWLLKYFCIAYIIYCHWYYMSDASIVSWKSLTNNKLPYYCMEYLTIVPDCRYNWS